MLGIYTFVKQLAADALNHASLVSVPKVQQLMRTFQADEYGHRARFSQADLGYGWVHYGLLRHLKPRRVLCVGSRHGFIPAVLAQACKDNRAGRVDFVDAGFGPKDKQAWTGVGFWKTPGGSMVFQKFGLGKWVMLHMMTTQRYVTQLKRAKKKLTYDYIYIDGDHSFRGVLRDYTLLWPFLRHGGLMVFHDISVRGHKREGKYGVSKLWQKLGKKQALTFSFSGSGLGVLQK